MQFNSNLVHLYNQLSPLLPEILDSFLVRKPVFIVSTPRSGSTLLFEQLTKLKNIWSIGSESHVIFREFPHLRAENSQLDSGCLSRIHADQQTSLLFKLATFSMLKDNKGQYLLDTDFASNQEGLFLEKTPRNALNIPFLRSVFPNAKFIYLYREPKQNIASIIEAWKLSTKTGQFITFANLPGWDRKNWCFLLPKDWKRMNGKSIAQIAYFQWKESNKQIIQDLKQVPNNHWASLDYDDFLEDPFSEIKKLTTTLSVNTNIQRSNYKELSHSKTTTTTPAKDKWKKHEAEINNMIPEMEQDYLDIKQFCSN